MHSLESSRCLKLSPWRPAMLACRRRSSLSPASRPGQLGDLLSSHTSTSASPSAGTATPLVAQFHLAR